MSRTTTQHILSTACALFAQRGLHAVTMEDVSKAAQVGIGTVYRHCATREALIRRAFDYAQVELCLQVRSPVPSAESLYEALRRRWLLVGERALAQPALFAYWVLVGATPGDWRPDPLKPWLPVFDRAQQVLTEVLATTAAQGELLTILLEAQWVASVQHALRQRRRSQSGWLPTQLVPESELLTQAYASWWAGLGLDRETRVPRSKLA
jgi:AcrR family transcriptional regulator